MTLSSRNFCALIIFISMAGCGKKAAEPQAFAPVEEPSIRPPEADVAVKTSSSDSHIPVQFTNVPERIAPPHSVSLHLPKGPASVENANVEKLADPVPQAPFVQAKPPEPKAKESEKEKDKMAGSVKIIEWPRDINGKTPGDFVKETIDPDPAIRELALRTLPMFGPGVRKETGLAKAVLARMDRIKELDPGVRAAAYEAAGTIASLNPDGPPGFIDDADTKEAIRILGVTANEAANGGATRLHAVQTLQLFGAKAESQVSLLVEAPAADVAYETRKAVATTLGFIGTHDKLGPSKRALHCLVFNLLSDRSAPVRLEAVQSIIMLGPPYITRSDKAIKDIKEVKEIPKVDDAAVAGYIAAMKKRLVPVSKKDKPTDSGFVEREKQVEIYLRLAMMRLDSREETDENLTAISRYISLPDTGPKFHALTVLGRLGAVGAKRINDVIKGLDSDDFDIVNTTVSTLVSMGAAGKPAIGSLEKLKKRPLKATDPKLKEEERKYWSGLADEAIKLIMEADKAPPPGEAKKP